MLPNSTGEFPTGNTTLLRGKSPEKFGGAERSENSPIVAT